MIYSTRVIQKQVGTNKFTFNILLCNFSNFREFSYDSTIGDMTRQ